jgi:hypothetical protein
LASRFQRAKAVNDNQIRACLDQDIDPCSRGRELTKPRRAFSERESFAGRKYDYCGAAIGKPRLDQAYDAKSRACQILTKIAQQSVCLIRLAINERRHIALSVELNCCFPRHGNPSIENSDKRTMPLYPIR